MNVYYCGQCRMMIAPHARFCSVCGSVVQPVGAGRRPVWAQLVWLLQRIVAIYVIWVALRIGAPVAIAATPVCAKTPAMLGIVPRQVGVIQPLVGVVGGESLLLVRACVPPPTWYVATTAPDWVVALAARDTTTWYGMGLARADWGVATAEQATIAGIRYSVVMVRSFLFDSRTW